MDSAHRGACLFPFLALPDACMKALPLLTLLALFAASTFSATAKMKVGVVNMQYLLNSFHETKTAEDEANEARAEIKKKDLKRMEAIQAIQEEIKTMAAEIQDPSLSVERRKKVAGQAGERERSMRELMKEREEYLRRQNRAMTEKMVTRLDELRLKVIKAVQQHAEETGVDYVIDSSGLTSSKVPFLLYVKEPVDITEGALKIVNADAPKAPAEKPAKK